MKKTYSFEDGEYLFRLVLSQENKTGSAIEETYPLGYDLSIDSQIDRSFSTKPKAAHEGNRKLITFAKGKRKERKTGTDTVFEPRERVDWVAVAGKYFVFIALPDPHYDRLVLRSTFNSAVGEIDSFSDYLRKR